MSKRGGYHGRQGNIKADVATIRLRTSPARDQLNALVQHTRNARNDQKISHKQIVEELIEEAWQELNQAYEAAAERAAAGGHAYQA